MAFARQAQATSKLQVPRDPRGRWPGHRGQRSPTALILILIYLCLRRSLTMTDPDDANLERANATAGSEDDVPINWTGVISIVVSYIVFMSIMCYSIVFYKITIT